jgi:uncharacterized protein with von Willebrand factor type A (vWA) domain
VVKAFVKALKPVGGTNINQSLLASLRQFSDADRERPKMLVFMTDGLPTVDETNVTGSSTTFARRANPVCDCLRLVLVTT